MRSLSAVHRLQRADLHASLLSERRNALTAVSARHDADLAHASHILRARFGFQRAMLAATTRTSQLPLLLRAIAQQQETELTALRQRMESAKRAEQDQTRKRLNHIAREKRLELRQKHQREYRDTFSPNRRRGLSSPVMKLINVGLLILWKAYVDG